ncbi:SGNH/GDSL hydrolase family protein [Coraliomargarita parva]|uniref:SGNH/GDSL hydrolase family protein n=1 Tax=Coraliomargarita parva TaxID=3014050 RepID=UPI0022B42E69|nr:SGNH/GDSL hydrolase family protein [Coraliomargarita parva]
MNHTFFTNLLERFESQTLTRILAYGSSNTERRLPGMHWFDCLDLAIQQRYGRSHRCINSGVGGETSRDLLERFPADAAFYLPHAVFITIGGNDSNPDQNMDLEEFEANLRELWRRFDAIGTQVCFQTYYALDTDGSERFLKYEAFAEAVRWVCEDTGAALVDHLHRWTPLRLLHPEIYRPLMTDPLHVNERGNKVMGVDLARCFGLELEPDPAVWGEALKIQSLMDGLGSKAYA